MFNPFIHYGLGYLFAIKLQMGVLGLSLSMFLTFSLGFSIQRYQMSRLEALQESNKVNLFDKRNLRNTKEYLKLAIPSIFLCTIEWLA